MAYPFTEDHEMIREAARGFLQDWYDGGKGPETLYQSGKSSDAAAWQSFSQELGMAGIAIPEAYGGAGLGDLGRVVVMEELGASLCAMPFSTTATIVPDLIEAFADEDVKSEWLGQIAVGALSATYCDGHDALSSDNNAISGKVSHVVHASDVDWILMTRRVDSGLQLFAIKTDANGLSVTPHQTMDPTRGFADVSLNAVSEDDITVLGHMSEDACHDVVTRSFIGLAAECLGGAQACLDMTLEYTGQRVQFDRTIASFQAIKHRCADMFVEIEAARSAVYYAATAPETEKTEAALAAKAYATDMFFDVAGTAIQLHGGIGFTWEYPLHFFFKRARANRTMFGSSARSYKQLADEIFGDAA